MARLKVGVVGLGVGEHHVEGYLASTEVARVVVCDKSEDRVAKIRSKLPRVADGYVDINAMIESERPDIVSVCVPDHFHRATAQKAFDAGCAVLLTKPIATNLEDARAIVEASKATGKPFMVAHERRFRSGHSLVKKLLDEGYFGDIVHLRADTIQDKRRQFAASPWFASEEAGRSALTGSGVHEVDLARYLIGRPLQRVFAASNRIGPLKFPRDKTTGATFMFDGDVIAQVMVTYEARWLEAGRIANDEFRLVATNGMVVGDKYRGGDDTEWKTLPFDEDEVRVGSLGCVSRFIESVVHGTPVAVTGEDALASLAAGIAADESAALGRVVEFMDYFSSTSVST